MKTDVNKKLLKLVSTEILLQIGFEKSTEQSLNILTDIASFYLETLIKRVIPIYNKEDKRTSKYLIEQTYEEEQYQIKELSKFLEQQIAIKTQLEEKHEIECEDSLFHSLKLLPKGITLKSVFKNTKALTLEEKKNREIVEDILVDEFMSDFIEKCSKEGGERKVEDYSLDCSKIIEKESGEGLVPFERMNTKGKENIFGIKDGILAVQELFIEDFYGTETFISLPY